MLEPFLDTLNRTTGSDLLAVSLLVAAYLALLWTRRGFCLLLAVFFLALAYATASSLRTAAPYLAVLPAILGVPLLLRACMFRNVPRPPRLVWCWVALMCCFTVRSMFSEVGLAALYWWAYYGVLFGLGLALGLLTAHPDYREMIVGSLALGSGAVLLLAGFAVVSSDPATYTQDRLTPFGVQANLWGPTSLVTLLNGLLYLQLGRGYRAQMLRSALVLVAALSLVLTFSRGSIFSCVLSGVVYVATGTKRVRGMAMVIVLAGCIAAALLVGSSSEVIDLRAGERLQNLTTESRMDLMSRLFSDYVLPNPTIGMGFFPKGGYAQVPQRGDPHNSFLLIWIEQGTVGLALLIGLIVFTYYEIVAALRLFPRGSLDQLLGRHALFAQTALLMNALTVPNLWTHHTVMGFDLPLRIGIVAGLLSRPAMQRQGAALARGRASNVRVLGQMPTTPRRAAFSGPRTRPERTGLVS